MDDTASTTISHAFMLLIIWGFPWEVSVPSFRRMTGACCSMQGRRERRGGERREGGEKERGERGRPHFQTSHGYIIVAAADTYCTTGDVAVNIKYSWLLLKGWGLILIASSHNC